MKRGTEVTVVMNDGRKLPGKIKNLAYRKKPQHWAVEIMKPSKKTKTGLMKVVLYLTLDRIIL